MSQHYAGLHDEDEQIERAQAHRALQMINRTVRLAKKDTNPSAKSPCRRQDAIEHERTLDQSSAIVEGSNHLGKSVAGMSKGHRIIHTVSCRSAGESFRFGGFSFPIACPAICLPPDVTIAAHPVGRCKIFVRADRPLKVLQSLEVGLSPDLIDIGHTTQKIVVSGQPFGRLALGTFDFGLFKLRRDRSDNLPGDFVLQIEDILDATVKMIRPQCAPVGASISCPVMRTLFATLRTLPAHFGKASCDTSMADHSAILPLAVILRSLPLRAYVFEKPADGKLFESHKGARNQRRASGTLCRVYAWALWFVSLLNPLCAILLSQRSYLSHDLVREPAMRLASENCASLALSEKLRAADDVTPGLMKEILDVICRRAPFQGRSVKVLRLKHLAEAHAWTDAALALIDLELPLWQLRRIAGQWHCALSRQRELPDWLNQSIEARHPDLALAILSALIEAATATASSGTSVRIASGKLSSDSIPLCCDNFA
ncbi:hypothetical protein [Bradyrhizobium sp. ARR65]|uniref:hypothetical protein n=1 Tax=Bradyrhizobium sp. ARR65 TaxID=1040989 RepID=UPI0012FBE639|nr:hypothetical protein [Bradyrhizobium sp. ARR65]